MHNYGGPATKIYCYTGKLIKIIKKLGKGEDFIALPFFLSERANSGRVTFQKAGREQKAVIIL